MQSQQQFQRRLVSNLKDDQNHQKSQQRMQDNHNQLLEYHGWSNHNQINILQNGFKAPETQLTNGGGDNSYTRKIQKPQKPTTTDAQFAMRNVSKTTMNQSIKVNSNIGKQKEMYSNDYNKPLSNKQMMQGPSDHTGSAHAMYVPNKQHFSRETSNQRSSPQNLIQNKYSEMTGLGQGIGMRNYNQINEKSANYVAQNNSAIKIKKRFTQQNFYLNSNSIPVQSQNHFEKVKGRNSHFNNSRNQVSQNVIQNLKPNKFIIKTNGSQLSHNIPFVNSIKGSMSQAQQQNTYANHPPNQKHDLSFNSNNSHSNIAMINKQSPEKLENAFTNKDRKKIALHASRQTNNNSEASIHTKETPRQNSLGFQNHTYDASIKEDSHPTYFNKQHSYQQIQIPSAIKSQNVLPLNNNNQKIMAKNPVHTKSSQRSQYIEYFQKVTDRRDQKSSILGHQKPINLTNTSNNNVEYASNEENDCIFVQDSNVLVNATISPKKQEKMLIKKKNNIYQQNQLNNVKLNKNIQKIQQNIFPQMVPASSAQGFGENQKHLQERKTSATLKQHQDQRHQKHLTMRNSINDQSQQAKNFKNIQQFQNIQKIQNMNNSQQNWQNKQQSAQNSAENSVSQQSSQVFDAFSRTPLHKMSITQQKILGLPQNTTLTKNNSLKSLPDLQIVNEKDENPAEEYNNQVLIAQNIDTVSSFSNEQQVDEQHLPKLRQIPNIGPHIVVNTSIGIQPSQITQMPPIKIVKNREKTKENFSTFVQINREPKNGNSILDIKRISKIRDTTQTLETQKEQNTKLLNQESNKFQKRNNSIKDDKHGQQPPRMTKLQQSPCFKNNEGTQQQIRTQRGINQQQSQLQRYEMMNVKNNQSVQSLQSIHIIDENQIQQEKQLKTPLGVDLKESQNLGTKQMLSQYSQSSLSSNMNSQSILPPYQQQTLGSGVLNTQQSLNKSQNQIVKSYDKKMMIKVNNNQEISQINPDRYKNSKMYQVQEFKQKQKDASKDQATQQSEISSKKDYNYYQQKHEDDKNKIAQYHGEDGHSDYLRHSLALKESDIDTNVSLSNQEVGSAKAGGSNGQNPEKGMKFIKSRNKYNLTPSDSQNELDKKNMVRESKSKMHGFKQQTTVNDNENEYQGIRIQISKEKKIKQLMVENPTFQDDQKNTSPNNKHINSLQNSGKHQKSIRQPQNQNFDFDMLSAANSIEHITQQEEQNTNLLFYNFNNTHNSENKEHIHINSRQKHRQNYKEIQQDSYQMTEENQPLVISSRHHDSSRFIPKQLRTEYDNQFDPKEDIQKSPLFLDDHSFEGEGEIDLLIDKDTQQTVRSSQELKDNSQMPLQQQSQNQSVSGNDNEEEENKSIHKASKTQYGGSNQRQKMAISSNSFANRQNKNGPINSQDAWLTQTTMTRTSGTGFQGASSIGFEEVVRGTATSGGGINKSTVAGLMGQDGNQGKTDSMINFGRNTLYNPRPKTDIFELFQVGDAQATSAAAANLVRPTNKPESRRSSQNSQIGLIQRKTRGQFSGLSGLRSKSRKESDDWQQDNNSIIEAANDNMENEDDEEDNSPSEKQSEQNDQNLELNHYAKNVKYSHQKHNKRMDFPYRKSAGGSSALSQISQAKQSLGQLQQARPSSIKMSSQNKMGRISPANSSNNDMQKNKMGLSGVCGGAFKNNGQIHEMIEEEVDEEEQNEGQDSQDE